MLLFIVITLLLCGNWFFTETLIYLPVNLISRLVTFGWWGVAALSILFLAWCVGED